MRIGKGLAVLAFGLSLMGLGPSGFAQEKDAAGCKDHPLISRMKNYYITSCEMEFFFAKRGLAPLHKQR